MRKESEMLGLILSVAKGDDRIRAVVLQGSRANPNAPKDAYRDYDILYIVRNLESFTADCGWINIFGKRLMLQMPEAMRNPSGKGHFNWMMLLCDGNRIDLTLIPETRLDLMSRDSLSIALLDKGGLLPPFPHASDKDYYVMPPSPLCFFSCCNNFWWCLQNVAKGLARDELPYAMMMYHQIVRSELHDMIHWYIGIGYGFFANAGKMGKYFKQYLPAHLYAQYCYTYSDCSAASIWQSLYTMCDLFHTLATRVADCLGYHYIQGDEDGIRAYLYGVQHGQYNDRNEDGDGLRRPKG